MAHHYTKALRRVPAPPDKTRLPSIGRTTTDLLADDPKGKAHLVGESQFEAFLALIGDGVRPHDALSSTKMTRVGFEHVLRSNDAARARYEEAKIQALYKQFDLETIEQVLAGVADGKHLKDVLADFLLVPQLFYMLVLKDPVVRELYEDAKKIQSEVWAEDLVAIGDDDSRDVLTVSNEYGFEERPNNARVQRDKLRSDNRKWLMARLHHDRYGDKQKIDLNANVTIDYASRLESARSRKNNARIGAAK